VQMTRHKGLILAVGVAAIGSLLQTLIIANLVWKRLGAIQGTFNDLLRDGVIDEQRLERIVGPTVNNDGFRSAMTVFGLSNDAGAFWLSVAITSSIVCVCFACVVASAFSRKQ